METHIYKVKGMHCASCVSLIQGKIAKVPGVESVSVGLSLEKAKVVFSDKPVELQALNSAISPFGYSFEDPAKKAPEAGMAGMDHARIEQDTHDAGSGTALEMKFVIPMVAFSFIMMFWEVLQKNSIVPVMPENVYEAAHHLMPIFASFVLFSVYG
jgi:copper chaperone CopZ